MVTEVANPFNEKTAILPFGVKIYPTRAALVTFIAGSRR